MKSLLLSIFTFLSVFSPVTSLHAGTENNLAGFAWSDNIGWISFNCTNDNSCGSVDYGVNQNPDGTLVGYAWSPSVGWIQFGNLSGFPSGGGGTQAQNANINGNNLKGWAKAIGADGNGWDGWISLSGSGYGVSLSGASFVGYGWGSSVVGWVSFDAANGAGVHITSSATLDAQAGGSSIANQTNVPYGTVATLAWTVNNLAGGSCSLSKTSSGGAAFTPVTNITSSGSSSTPGLTSGPYTFGISCVSGGNTIASSNVSFTILPQPPGFSLGADDTIKIAFLPSGWSQSELKTVAVSTVGGFTGNVTVNISQYPTMPNASTTAKYSINGGAWTATPSITIPYNGSFTFRVEVSAPLTASYCSSGSNPCVITLQGTSPSIPSATKNFTITPTIFNPQFHEY